MAEHRIVSLIASATEMVAALGFEEQLVGRSHECDFPPSVERLPVCSAAKVDAGAPSRAIDAQVRAIVADALSVYHVDASLLDRLAPTVIVTQAQCEVCAVSLADVERAVGDLVASSAGDRFAGADGARRRPAGRQDGGGGARRAGSRRGSRRPAHRAAGRDPRGGCGAARPSIACIEWIDPLMHAGNWMPELVEIAGGVVMIGEAGRHSGYLDVEELAARDPDVVAIMPCAARGGTPRRTESGEAPG